MVLLIIKLIVSIMVNKVSRLIEKFNLYIIIKVVIREIGMVIVGIKVVWILFKNR